MELKRCSDCANGAWTGEERTLPEVCTICRFKSDGEPSEWKPKVFTNADRIRSTDDELATMLHAVSMGYKPWCDYHCENEGDDGCDNCIKNWLQQPAEG